MYQFVNRYFSVFRFLCIPDNFMGKFWRNFTVEDPPYSGKLPAGGAFPADRAEDRQLHP